MFERFTGRAMHAVTLAQTEARKMGAGEIETGHLLLALAEEKGGLAAAVLADEGVTQDKIISGLGLVSAEGPTPITQELKFSPATRKALEMALREALSLGHNYIGTEHLLLGVMRYRDVSQALGVEPDALRQAVLRTVMGVPTEATEEVSLEQRLLDAAEGADRLAASLRELARVTREEVEA